jgi:hypothetical protein
MSWSERTHDNGIAAVIESSQNKNHVKSGCGVKATLQMRGILTLCGSPKIASRFELCGWLWLTPRRKQIMSARSKNLEEQIQVVVVHNNSDKSLLSFDALMPAPLHWVMIVSGAACTSWTAVLSSRFQI